ncbi:hypothetical protein PG996_000011 [Apiospora saccharicola]|uniref:Uncharacterized protein n=1 Tax=Apiospora saccharicola TaxID=335842 RepID=A0ABR1WFH4_9PEZI
MTAAYLDKEVELSNFLKDAFAGDKTAAAYLAAHETGQTTWMLGHVTDLATSSNAGPVVYVTPKTTNWTTTRLTRRATSCSAPTTTCPGTTCRLAMLSSSTSSCIARRPASCSLPTCWTRAARTRVEAMTTRARKAKTMTAMMAAKAARAAKTGSKDDEDEGPVLTVLCVAARVSSRTTDALERYVEGGVTVIQVPDNRKPLEPEVVPEDQFNETVKTLIKEHQASPEYPGLAVVLTNPDKLEDHLTDDSWLFPR